MNAPKDPNHKDVIGVTKVPLNLIPPAAKAHTAMAFRDGAVKYGPYNWRDHPVKASVYMAAIERHIDAFRDGEDFAGDSGVHHLGHAIANLAILIDAQEYGNLIDDRPVPLDLAALHERLRAKEEDFIAKVGATIHNHIANEGDGTIDDRVKRNLGELRRAADDIPRRVPRMDSKLDHVCLTEPEDDGFETVYPTTPDSSGRLDQ